MTDYCDAAPGHPWHGPYHDREYGFPIESEAGLFELLVLEINQAGLSWLTILKKRESFRAAYAGFDVDRVAAFGEADRQRLLADSGIVRNRLKVNAAIENARRIRGDRRGVFDVQRLLARRPSRRLPGLRQDRRLEAGLDERPGLTSLLLALAFLLVQSAAVRFRQALRLHSAWSLASVRAGLSRQLCGG